MAKLNKVQIFNAADIKLEEVEVPEWGGSVTVRTMTGAQRDEFELSNLGKKRAHIRAKLAMYSVINEDGSPMFTMSDVEELSKKSSKALDRILDATKRLSGISEEDVKELEKN